MGSTGKNEPRDGKNFQKYTAEEVASFSPQINWRQTFSYNPDKKSNENIFLLDKPNIITKKTGSDVILKVQEKLSNLQEQLEKQRIKLLEAKEESLILQEQLSDHSKFSTSLGAVLGNLLWHASKVPNVVDLWIKKFQLHSKFEEFLGAVNGTFCSFIKTYGEAKVPIASDECQFVMSLLGVTANVSAISEGRQFIATRLSGVELIKNLVEYFSSLQLTTPKYALWRLILTILYNISLNVIGVKLLLDFQIAEKVLSLCFEECTPKDINLLCLRILDTVTYDLVDPEHLQEIILFISLERIDKVALTADTPTIYFIKEIKKNLKKSRSLLQTSKRRPSDK